MSTSTFARVMQAARNLDYIPNAAARSLSGRRSNLVAVLVSLQAQLHYPEVLSELSAQFGRRGMRLLLFSMARESDVGTTLAELWQHQVDGAVVAARLSAYSAWAPCRTPSSAPTTWSPSAAWTRRAKR